MVCRLASIDKTVLAGTKRLICSNDRSQTVPVSPLLLSHLVNISSSAALDSIHHVQAEIVTAETTFSVLLDALRRFTKGSRARHRCALPRVKDVCTDISVLWRGEDHIQTVRNELEKVSRILDVAAGELSAVGEGRDAALLTAADASISIDVRRLEESMRKLFRCSWFAQQVRKIAGAVSEAAKT